MRPLKGHASDLSLVDLALERARALGSAVGLEHRTDELMRLCTRLIRHWGRAPIGSEPEWPSHVVDDGTPFEFSIAFGKRPQLRFMFEPLGTPPSLSANASTGRTLLSGLARDFELDLTRFERIADLFLPRQPQGPLALWIAVAISGEGPPDFKLYLNPQAAGAGRGPAVIEQALVRLGFDRAWSWIGNVLARRGPPLDELKYFSLDLSRDRGARVKVYARHHLSTPEVVVKAAAGCASAELDLIRRFLATVSPDRSEFDGRGPFTCYAFVEGQSAPNSVTTHFPINGYCPNDEVVSQRVRACFEAFGMPKEPYAKVLAAIANRPLSQDVGLNSYVSFRHHQNETRLTLYLPAEAYAPGTVENPRIERSSSGVTECISGFPGLEMEQHPFVGRLERDAFEPGPVLCLARTAIVALEGVDQELRELAAELEHPEMNELLQIFVELPAEHTRSHLEWLSSVTSSFSIPGSAELDGRALRAARYFRNELRECRRSREREQRVGAAFGSALFAIETCSVVAERLRGQADFARLPTLRAPILPAWSLSARVARDAHINVSQGVNDCSTAAWRLLNELYDVCYG